MAKNESAPIWRLENFFHLRRVANLGPGFSCGESAEISPRPELQYSTMPVMPVMPATY
jgi:hypothetical protein